MASKSALTTYLVLTWCSTGVSRCVYHSRAWKDIKRGLGLHQAAWVVSLRGWCPNLLCNKVGSVIWDSAVLLLVLWHVLWWGVTAHECPESGLSLSCELSCELSSLAPTSSHWFFGPCIHCRPCSLALSCGFVKHARALHYLSTAQIFKANDQVHIMWQPS